MWGVKRQTQEDLQKAGVASIWVLTPGLITHICGYSFSPHSFSVSHEEGRNLVKSSRYEGFGGGRKNCPIVPWGLVPCGTSCFYL